MNETVMNQTTENEQKANIPEVKKELSAQITQILENLFDSVLFERKMHYKEHERPMEQGIDALIDKYAYLNAGISGAANAVPGPWGLIAVIPEITLVIRNQLCMIYDIAAAYKKDKIIDKTLLMAVFAVGIGGGALGLLIVHGGKVIVKRAALRVIQKLIIILGGQVTQKLIKAVIAKWLPVVGPVAMATWAQITTKKIGKKAKEIFSKEIDFQSEI